MRDFDLIDQRISTLEFSKSARLDPIPYPSGYAPTPVAAVLDNPSGSLPMCDVLVVTWTAAEAEALADVLTPGFYRQSWRRYTKNWDAFSKEFTSRSPAREADALAHYWATHIGNVRVLTVKSELHLATDSDSAPIAALWQQMIADCKPKFIITTGTAGGIGSETLLGDVFVVTNAKFNCTQDFKSKPWAQERFTGTPVQAENPDAFHNMWMDLMSANDQKLLTYNTGKKNALYFGGDVETVDYFAFADTDDSYGVIKNDPAAHTEEMDDATLPLALSRLEGSILWCSVRNASDPQVASTIGDLEAQKKWASKIYNEYGYYTSLNSVLACYCLILQYAGQL